MTFHELGAMQKGQMIVVDSEDYTISNIEYGFEEQKPTYGFSNVNRVIWILRNSSGEDVKQMIITKTNTAIGYYVCTEPYSGKLEFDTTDVSGFIDSIPLMEGA